MRKRTLAMLLAIAVFVVSGPMEVFALTESEGVGSESIGVEAASTSDEALSVEEITEEEGKTVVEETAEPSEQGTNKAPALAAAPVEMTVNVSSIEYNQAVVTWDQVDGANEYIVMVDGDEYTTEETSQSVSGLTENTEYEVKVTAYAKSDAGDEVIGEGSTSFTTGIQAPYTVGKVSTLSEFNSVTVQWTGVSNADGYYIDWYQTGKPNSYKGKVIVGETVRSARVPATENVDYTYRVYAFRKVDGKTVYSSAKTASGSAIRLMKIRITFKRARTLTSHSGGKVKTTFKKGLTLNASGFTNGKYTFSWRCSDGKVRTYYVTRISIKSPKIVKVVNGKTYSAAEVTKAVNDLRISSKTNRLIFVNQYTQKLYVFTGSAGKWKLTAGPWLISSGKASEPTSTGRTNIKLKVKSRHGLPCWSICNWFSLHGKNSSWKLGFPRSGACIRNTNDHARWIYNNCKTGTTVYIY